MAVAFVVLALAACESRIDTRGNQLDLERVAEVKPGQITKDEVVEILGSPSNVTTFGDEAWYYISERTETFAFLESKVAERQIVVLRFDKQGLLTEIKMLGEKDGKRIEHVERTTPTHGNELTVLDQIIGNFQRFTGRQGADDSDGPGNY